MGGIKGEDDSAITRLPILIKPDAEQEMIQAFNYYETKIAGLGVRFREDVGDSLDRISIHPHGFATVEGKVRRVLLRRFPYGIFYFEERQKIVVIACFHCRRDPVRLKGRIASSA